jgi:8-oxo-dGTP diphosphatase
MNTTKRCVLVFFINREGKKVLLARKHSGAKIGAGMWNGYGGGIEGPESSKKAVIRETIEEAGEGLIVRANDLFSRGSITFYYHDNKPICSVELFVCYYFEGEAVSTEEMIDPTWFEFLKISSLPMMPGDKLFIPHLLMGKSISNGYIIFTKGLFGVKSYSLPVY